MSEPAARISPEHVVGYRSQWSILHGAGLLVIWIVCSLVTFLVVPSLFVKAIVAAVALVLLVPVIRRLGASLTMTPDGLIVRSTLGTKRLLWDVIEGIDVGSRRIVGSGSKAYFLRYQIDGQKVPVQPTLVGGGRSGRATIIMLLDVAEHACAGSNVSISRSDPWNAGTTFPRLTAT